jgi:hypothetical protein
MVRLGGGRRLGLVLRVLVFLLVAAVLSAAPPLGARARCGRLGRIKISLRLGQRLLVRRLREVVDVAVRALRVWAGGAA